jgi:hypothetical protein
MSTGMSLGDEAEQYLRSLAAEPASPHPGECLRCYVRRMVSRHGCDNGLRWVRRWQGAAAQPHPGLIRRLERQGGYCDCARWCSTCSARTCPRPRRRFPPAPVKRTHDLT